MSSSSIVGYSKLSINEQHAAVEQLSQIVRASEQLQRAEATHVNLALPRAGNTFRALRKKLAKRR